MSTDHSTAVAEDIPEQFATLGELADEFGMEKSNLRKWAIDRGFAFHKRRVPGNGGNLLQAALTIDQADHLRRLRREAGFFGGSAKAPVEAGFFYVIALVPELDPRKLKFGFADILQARLDQHRTAAPTARILKSWPCKRAWERAVMDALGAGCRLVWSEVFECDDVPALLRKGDDLFAILPTPDFQPTLSEHSPYREAS